ncbi:type III glutamate--ammonia ligase [Roseicyclus persicicus]|uniref:Type III glutamate--ammonia ligase n=1 Tax=Roseicyclus persicicus TaxID=2650661 RepID=A0A7X6GZN4_9RHOB|nr:type III glutamate--ammonia ligase [Roseibacterium persicicum]NKX44062.1 type III glutamate--ammonia ligase [Roseibacterium persicicum]
MTDLAAIAKEKGIRFFLISFTDLLGVQRAKLAPAQAIADMAVDGAGFAGFATWLDMSPADADILAIPDPDSLIQLPWKPEVGWLAADVHFHGAPFAKAPRVVLKSVIARAAAQDIHMKHGVECEFFLTTPDGRAISDAADTQIKPCYDQDALMRRYDVIAEIASYMVDLGWGAYQNDHEDANGQFEMNWAFGDALLTADRHAFFKFMARSVAEKHGLRATFMPKPFANLTGNGCHAHVSLWNAAGTNLFPGDGELGLSDTAYAFLGGLIGHAPALAAVLNPTVNSYKRLNAPVTVSGSTWSPNTISYGGNNRTHMVRIPDHRRIEVRLADGAANPYLMPAAILAAGLDGIATKADPGQRLDIDMYVDGHTVDAPKLPLNLLDAVRAFEADEGLRNALGAEASAAFAKYKRAEWMDYTRHLTEWERQTTLDC